MRVVADIPHPGFKITLFAWNERYLLKFEAGSLEQTYKLDELDYSKDEMIELTQNETFMKGVKATFDTMGNQLGEALSEL